jgi:hypothetical protein
MMLKSATVDSLRGKPLLATRRLTSDPIPNRLIEIVFIIFIFVCCSIIQSSLERLQVSLQLSLYAPSPLLLAVAVQTQKVKRARVEHCNE